MDGCKVPHTAAMVSFNLKNLDVFSKTDLDFWVCFRGKTHLTGFCNIDFDILGHSKDT